MTIWESIYKILGDQKEIRKEMTSIPITTLRAGKKTSSNPSAAIASPSSQRTINGMINAEKSSQLQNTPTMQSTLIMIQERMVKLQDTMSRNKIEKLDNKFDSIQEAIQKNEQKIKTVEVKAERTEKKLEQVDQRMMETNKNLEGSLVHLEMDRASFYLRFQNITETKDEDLGKLMAN
uniref:Uncharacterized protein n=1 Tax=Micrurus lemniscatus lemniscatus TaxID=129467 RepID=A0A2D4IZZ8_MICLE